MQIRYRNTLEDAMAFTKYHYANSDTVKKQKTKAMIYGPITFVALMCVLAAMMQEVNILIWGCVFIAAYMFFIRRAYKTGTDKIARKLYAEQDTRGFICEHLLEINEEGIFERTDLVELKHKWAGVQRIVVDNSYAFVCTGAFQAYIIPRERIIEGNFDHFIETAQTYWQRGNLKYAHATDA